MAERRKFSAVKREAIVGDAKAEGVSAAAKKHKVSPGLIYTWINKSKGVEGAGRTKKGAKADAGRMRAIRAGGGISGNVAREIKKEIARLEAQIATLKATLAYY